MGTWCNSNKCKYIWLPTHRNSFWCFYKTARKKSGLFLQGGKSTLSFTLHFAGVLQGACHPTPPLPDYNLIPCPQGIGISNLHGVGAYEEAARTRDWQKKATSTSTYLGLSCLASCYTAVQHWSAKHDKTLDTACRLSSASGLWDLTTEYQEKLWDFETAEGKHWLDRSWKLDFSPANIRWKLPFPPFHGVWKSTTLAL